MPDLPATWGVAHGTHGDNAGSGFWAVREIPPVGPDIFPPSPPSEHPLLKNHLTIAAHAVEEFAGLIPGTSAIRCTLRHPIKGAQATFPVEAHL